MVTGRYVIEYEFLDFEDSKYPMRMPKPGATWARVTCSLQCGCGLHIVHETQNNQGRPFNVACECGVVLVTEIEEIPKIQELF